MLKVPAQDRVILLRSTLTALPCLPGPGTPPCPGAMEQVIQGVGEPPKANERDEVLLISREGEWKLLRFRGFREIIGVELKFKPIK